MLNSLRRTANVAFELSRPPIAALQRLVTDQPCTQLLGHPQLLSTQLAHQLHTCHTTLQEATVGSHTQNAPKAPWTPTAQLQKRKTLTKRMGFLMQTLDAEQTAAMNASRPLPDFGPGDVVELRMAVAENRRKVALMKGVIIARKNRGWQSAFTIRNYLGNAGGIERTFPLYSPTLLGVKVLEHRPVRRAKLYYLRNRKPAEYRVQ